MKIYPWAGKICFFYYPSEILRCCDRRWLQGNVRCHGVRDHVQLHTFSTALVKIFLKILEPSGKILGLIIFILGCNKKSYPQIMSNFRKEEQILINFCNFIFVFHISNQVFTNAVCFECFVINCSFHTIISIKSLIVLEFNI